MTRAMFGRHASARLTVLFLTVFAAAAPSWAQRFKVLFSFNGNDGGNPNDSALVQGPDSNLYGTSSYGGISDYGTVFKVTPTVTVTTLYSFCVNLPYRSDGVAPDAGLVLGPDGNLNGTSIAGGTFGGGTVFQITPAGVLTALHSFDGYDGEFPETPLVLASNGNFYGTTSMGGNAQQCPGFYAGCGSLFEITPTGTFTLLHVFNLEDGATPQAGLIQGTDGNFYGTTFYGGSLGYGTVFKMSPSATQTASAAPTGNIPAAISFRWAGCSTAPRHSAAPAVMARSSE
jgi:uncharacterized repeat protein (TIGR03803 family)